MSEQQPVRVDKPWGYELHWAVTERYIGKILHVKRGHALSLQFHERKDESLMVMTGTVDVDLDDAQGQLHTHRLEKGETLRIRPRQRHRITAIEDTDVLEVSSPEIDDIVRLEDRYGRVRAPQPAS